MGKYEALVEPNLDKIESFAMNGMSEEKIAANVGVAPSTFREYKKKFPALSAVLKKCACARDEAVEDALYKSATGGYVTEKKPEKVRRVEYDPATGKKVKEYEEVVMVEEVRHVPGNTAAQIFYLINRLPGKYKNNPGKLRIDEEKLKLAKEQAQKEDW